MQPSHSRLICRAHNSLALPLAPWQPFVAFPQSLRHQKRLITSATEVVANTLGSDGRTPDNPAANGTVETDVVGSAEAAPKTEGVPVYRYFSKESAWVNRHGATASRDFFVATKAAYMAREDYQAVDVKPPTYFAEYKDLPWVYRGDEKPIRGYDRLAVEIDRFYQFSKPDQYEQIARNHVIEQVRDHVRQFFPDQTLSVFGSERTGLAFATSDIDLRWVRKGALEESKYPPKKVDKNMGKAQLIDLRRKFTNLLDVYCYPSLLHARYPLVSIKDRQTGLDIQIVLCNDSRDSRAIMKAYMEQYPYLRSLHFVVKTIFDVRGLSEVFHGGFGSYSIFMMIVASIQQNPHPRGDAAGALLNFLKFWRDFDTKKYVISIEPNEIVEKDSVQIMSNDTKQKLQKGLGKPLPRYMLSLRDPADETNDLGRKGIMIKHVQVTFGSLFWSLSKHVKENTRPSLLGDLVAASYEMNRTRRSQLRKYGVSLAEQMPTSPAEEASGVDDSLRLRPRWSMMRRGKRENNER